MSVVKFALLTPLIAALFYYVAAQFDVQLTYFHAVLLAGTLKITAYYCGVGAETEPPAIDITVLDERERLNK